MLSVYEKKQPFGTPKEDKDPDDPSFLDPDGPGANENPPSQVSEDQVLTPPPPPQSHLSHSPPPRALTLSLHSPTSMHLHSPTSTFTLPLATPSFLVQDEEDDWHRSPTEDEMAEVPLGHLGLVDSALAVDRLQYDVQACMLVYAAFTL